MKHLILILTMLITSLTMSAQKYDYQSMLYFSNIPIHTSTTDFKDAMKGWGFKYKETNKHYNQMLFVGNFISNTDTIIAEFSKKTKRVGKVSVITPFTNYDSIVMNYTTKYGNPIFANNDVIYDMKEGQIKISYDDTSIIITYFDIQGYCEINEDILMAI